MKGSFLWNGALSLVIHPASSLRNDRFGRVFGSRTIIPDPGQRLNLRSSGISEHAAVDTDRVSCPLSHGKLRRSWTEYQSRHSSPRKAPKHGVRRTTSSSQRSPAAPADSEKSSYLVSC